MPTTRDLAEARYTAVTSTTRALVGRIQTIWADLSATTIERDLQGAAGAAILSAVVEGQMTVAEGASAFVAACVAAQTGGAPVAQVALVAAAFSGSAGDGRPLESLLFVPALGVRRRLAAGLPAQEAMLGGLADMAMYAATAVADTARDATQAAMAADGRVVAYTRIVRLPACARCIVLAGRQYAYSEGFLRHPNCDCQTVPLTEDRWGEVPTAEELYAQMGEEQRRRVFGGDGARALERGADIGQVVNARRGMATADATTTTEGGTRRGLYGRRAAGGGTVRLPGERYSRAAQARLTPGQVFRQASGRREQVALLRRYGYIV